MLFAHFIHQRLEFINVFKAAVDAGKAHVGNLVQFFEFAHHEFADAGALDFAQAQIQEFFFYALDGAIDLLGAYRPFAQGQVHGSKQFGPLEFDAAAVFLDDGRKIDVRPLVGGEAFVASAALAPAADEVPIFRNPRLHHLGFGMTAERALHRELTLLTCKPGSARSEHGLWRERQQYWLRRVGCPAHRQSGWPWRGLLRL